MEVLFIESRSDLELNKEFLSRILEKVKGKSVGLATTVQYLEQLKVVDEFLKENNIKVLKEKAPFCKYPCQVLGCSAMKYNSSLIVYLGNGRFHPLGLAFSNDCPVLIANPETEKVDFLDEEEIKRYKTKLATNKKLVQMAKTVGILVSSKEGQSKMGSAEILKKKLEKEGKTVYLFLFDTLDFDSFLNYAWVDAYINTACPRLFDDIEKFNKPLINIEYYERDSY